MPVEKGMGESEDIDL